MAHQTRGLPQLRIKFYNTVAAGLQIVLLLTVLPQESLCGRHEKRLLNNLLANYNTLERPVANESEPLEVKFGITLQQIIDVDEKNQILTTNAWLKLEWTDYNLQWNESEYGGVKDLRITPNKLWKPDILMYNSADEGFDGTYQTNVVVTHNGSCLYVPPGIFKSTCKIDITWFPFDDQHCDMKFGSWTYDGNQFLQQHQHYKSTLEIFRLEPTEFNKSLDELITFLAQVAHCYPDDLKTYPQEIVDILQTHNTILDNEMRMTFCKALIQLRNKSLLEPTALLTLCFELLKSQDKNLRQFLQTHIVTDIKNINAKHKNAKVNTVLQNFMFSMLKNPDARAAKMSIDIMIELYNKNVWNDVKTVNVIATGCFSKITKVTVASMKFFLGTDKDEKESDDSDSDDEPNMKEIMMANKVNKKTKKRQKQLKKAKQLFVKAKKKKSKAPQYNFSALHLIHDPQDFAEKLFKQIEKNNDRFEVKLMTLDVVSRLIGLHNLFLLNFYPYIQRFLQPHQREVTKLLQFIAQASHELVPPDVLEPVLKTLANNFVTERNSADVMAIGLNTVREICTRCPLAMNGDLLEDLSRYKHYKERSVMMAAHSLIGTFRRIMPDLLHKKDKGRPTEANIMIKSSKYGEIRASEFIPGAEVLYNQDAESAEETDNSDEEDDDEWIDVNTSSEEDVSDDESISDVDETAKSSADEVDDKDSTLPSGKNKSAENTCEVNNEEQEIDKISSKKNVLTKQQKKAQKLEKKIKQKLEQNEELTAERKTKASVISTERLLTDKDFRKIDVALAKQEVTYAKRSVKRTHDQMQKDQGGELVKLSDIENIYKKRKHDKAARQKSVKKGQEGRDKFGFKDRRQNPQCSTTNREKRKGKAFQMLKQKFKAKVKRSFREKQIALKNHLIKQRRMK